MNVKKKVEQKLKLESFLTVESRKEEKENLGQVKGIMTEWRTESSSAWLKRREWMWSNDVCGMLVNLLSQKKCLHL